jgi:flagellar hook protein FlgE
MLWPPKANASGAVTSSPLALALGGQSINMDLSQIQLGASSSLSATGNDALPSANVATSKSSEETSLVVYDNIGGAHTINIYFTNLGPTTTNGITTNNWEVDAFDASKASAAGGFPYSSGPLGTGTLTFNTNNGTLSGMTVRTSTFSGSINGNTLTLTSPATGTMKSGQTLVIPGVGTATLTGLGTATSWGGAGTYTISGGPAGNVPAQPMSTDSTLPLTNPPNFQLPIEVPNGTAGQTFSLNLSNTTQLETSFNVTAATANGNAPASLQGVSIAQNGTLSFTYSNGTQAQAYGIPLANVESPDSLAAVSGNAFTATVDSGPIFLGNANEASLGAIESSSLESSTVDLATELTNMIEAQSSYQTNSKVFQTGATLLDILNNLKS